jgi:HAD superfamily hydrolase (TIGR01484 family)
LCQVKETLLFALNSDEVRAALARITHIYTDLDGTLLAPGGRLLTNHRGRPSISAAKCLTRLVETGTEITIVTGRDVASSIEIMRLANLRQVIAEMGCITQTGYGAVVEKRYYLGEWSAEHFDQDYNQVADITPHEMIAKSQALAALLAHFKGRLEVQELKGSHREVTFTLRGDVDTAPGGEVERLLAGYDLPLQLLDNGIIHPRNHGLLEVEDIHVYHLMPRGTGKGEAVAADMAEKGLVPEQVLAIGDSEGDLGMGRAVGVFVLVDNGLPATLIDDAENVVDEAEHRCGKLVVTSRRTIDGWVDMAHALLTAQGH